MKPGFWWIYAEIIFFLTMQTAAYTTVFKEFAVNLDYMSDSLLEVIRNIES